MPSVNFFTPITDVSKPSALTFVDNYFYLGGKKAYLIAGQSKTGPQKAVLSDGQISKLEKIAKIISYFLIAPPLLMLAAKALLRLTHSFERIDPKALLEKDITVNDAHLATIRSKLQSFKNRDSIDGIQWKDTREGIFFFTDSPATTYVIRRNATAYYETPLDPVFDHMVRGKEVTLAHQLDSLVIPAAKRIELDYTHHLIVMESKPLTSFSVVQEKNPSSLDQVVRQLATFVAAMQLRYVSKQTVHLLKDANPPQMVLSDYAFRMVGCIIPNAFGGFYGYPPQSDGLRSMISTPTQAREVAAVAKQFGVGDFYKEFEDAQKERKALAAFYQERKIAANTTLEVDIEALGLPLDEKESVGEYSYTMRDATEVIIRAINRKLEASSPDESIQERRLVALSIPHDGIKLLTYLGGDEKKENWIARILRALEEQKHIFRFHGFNDLNYHIQA